MTKEDGSKHELTDHAKIAGHISAVYRKIFSNNFSSDMESVLEFVGDDKGRIGKIYMENMNRIKEDITITEMKQGLRALQLESLGGPDGLSAMLLNHLAQILPNLVLGGMQEITLVQDKPYKLSRIFFIFINKPYSNKRCHKKLMSITLISNLLKITSRAI